MCLVKRWLVLMPTNRLRCLPRGSRGSTESQDAWLARRVATTIAGSAPVTSVAVQGNSGVCLYLSLTLDLGDIVQNFEDCGRGEQADPFSERSRPTCAEFGLTDHRPGRTLKSMVRLVCLLSRRKLAIVGPGMIVRACGSEGKGLDMQAGERGCGLSIRLRECWTTLLGRRWW